MSGKYGVVDRFEIEELRAEVTDAVMMRDFDRVASLFTPDAVMRWPHVDKEFVGRDQIRAGIEWGQGLWEFFVQHVHGGVVRLDGGTAVGRAYIQEFGRMRDGSSHLNHALYHDRYQRTSDGWKFSERVYEVRYLDSTPLTGSPPEHSASTEGELS
ncbi:nuclear transport factor 2 family protein [Streptomyces phaeolivaceus]|uniref:Nuclear transport factor 2 family protein n=1 Tax=Streptomyces phaeolivaceus TaxID=2653200 RepID=A0A5P8KFY9_9ACTN|nr:nuclear transport factor 2 family protein [Streptomyces phaeolivaceus]QFR02186.1 nuclear transport factor 2 family protein [Streptomyces phaeolivaceus]